MRTIEMSISKSQIIDQVAALMYAYGVVNDNEEIKDIQFPGLTGTEEVVPIKVTFRKQLEGKVSAM